jgi:hypothetical protein
MRTALIILSAAFFFFIPVIVAWVLRRRWGEDVWIMTTARVSAADLAGFLAEVARNLDERPRRIRLTFCHDGSETRSCLRRNGTARAERGRALDFTPERTIIVKGAGEAFELDLRGRWIPEHEVPLRLGRRTRVYVDPVEENRFRVRTAPPFVVPPAVWILCSAVAVCGVLALSPLLLAVSVGAAAGCLLVHHP